MNEITQVPQSVTSAGHGFSYASWPAGTTVKLANVRWGADYKDIVEFDSKADFISYINRLSSTTSITIPNMTYAKPFQPLKIPVPFNVASKYNYLLVHNPPFHGNSSDVGEYYAYFITSMDMVNPGTTQLTVQLDVWQTYGHDVEFGQAYLERGHLPMHPGYVRDWRDLINLTVPEGLDTGSDYAVMRQNIVRMKATDTPGAHSLSVIVVSTVDLIRSGGTTENPRLVSASGSQIGSIPNGADVYFFETGNDFNGVLDALADQPWITQGIISAMLVPALSMDDVTGISLSRGGINFKRMTGYNAQRVYEVYESWYEEIEQAIPIKYRDLKKFFTYPYAFFELTMYNGAPLVIKPERIGSESLSVHLMQHLTPPNPRSQLVPHAYNSGHVVDNTSLWDAGDSLDFATGLHNMPQTSIVNNAYLNYMASNARSIEYQHRSADWSQNRIMASAMTQAAQATGAIDTAADVNARQRRLASDSTSVQNTADLTQSGVSAIGGVAGGLMRGAGGLASGAVSGATGMINTAVGNANRSMQTNMSNSASFDVVSRQNQQTGLVRDTNYRLAEVVSKGDYENEIAGINARVQDAQMIQPTISGQLGGEGFMIQQDLGYTFRVKVKTVDSNVMDMLAMFWRRYGYAVNRMINLGRMNGRERLRCMSAFSYWKLKEMYLTSSRCPESFRATIRGIFEKGVTIWNNPSDIGTMPINEPVDMGYIGL